MKKLMILFLMCISCDEKTPFSEYSFNKELRLSRLDTMKIPSVLRTQLDDDYFILSVRPVERTETQKKVVLNNISREYLPMDVLLIGDKKVLKEPNYLLKLDGGGEVDFSLYTKKTIGDFLLGVRLDQKYTKTNTKVYFLNNLKSQGCNQYKDITDYFFSVISRKGLLTSVKDFIHLKLLVGAMVLISNVDDQYYIGQIHFTDSRIKKLLCR